MVGYNDISNLPNSNHNAHHCLEHMDGLYLGSNNTLTNMHKKHSYLLQTYLYRILGCHFHLQYMADD